MKIRQAFVITTCLTGELIILKVIELVDISAYDAIGHDTGQTLTLFQICDCVIGRCLLQRLIPEGLYPCLRFA